MARKQQARPFLAPFPRKVVPAQAASTRPDKLAVAGHGRRAADRPSTASARWCRPSIRGVARHRARGVPDHRHDAPGLPGVQRLGSLPPRAQRRWPHMHAAFLPVQAVTRTPRSVPACEIARRDTDAGAGHVGGRPLRDHPAALRRRRPGRGRSSSRTPRSRAGRVRPGSRCARRRPARAAAPSAGRHRPDAGRWWASSSTYRVWPRCCRCSSVASLIRCASPPDSSVAGWPSRR